LLIIQSSTPVQLKNQGKNAKAAMAWTARKNPALRQLIAHGLRDAPALAADTDIESSSRNTTGGSTLHHREDIQLCGCWEPFSIAAGRCIEGPEPDFTAIVADEFSVCLQSRRF
jgi:hypothetical protein